VSGPVRLTPQMELVIRHALEVSAREWFGLEIVRATGLKQGTVYPMLGRMRRWGWVSVRYESIQEVGTEPRAGRRYLRFTAAGELAARAALNAAAPVGVLEAAS
jgi:PadR family transcriptional regulator, regulatory protein PadR